MPRVPRPVRKLWWIGWAPVVYGNVWPDSGGYRALPRPVRMVVGPLEVGSPCGYCGRVMAAPFRRPYATTSLEKLGM